MTREELAEYDGRNDQPAYVAVSGVIYDVSASPMWQNGNHVDQHQAGQDLTEALKKAPHVRMVIERFPTVGQLSAVQPAPPPASKQTVLTIAAILVAVLLGWLLLR